MTQENTSTASTEATQTASTEQTPAVATTPNTEVSAQASTEQTTPETPKTPPSAKDWASVTAAEKKARAIEAKAKDELKKIQADRAEFEKERSQKQGLEALKEAYKSGNYDQLEKEFPGLYKSLTQAKLKTQRNPILTKESILKEFEERQAVKEKETAKKADEAKLQEAVSYFTFLAESNKAKYPLLMIESEENPDFLAKSVKEFTTTGGVTYQEGLDLLEKILNERFTKRQKILGAKTSETKTESDNNSPNNQDKKIEEGQNKSSDGPTTISQRMTQETSLGNANTSQVKEDENSPTVRIKRQKELERIASEKAIADFNELMKKKN